MDTNTIQAVRDSITREIHRLMDQGTDPTIAIARATRLFLRDGMEIYPATGHRPDPLQIDLLDTLDAPAPVHAAPHKTEVKAAKSLKDLKGLRQEIYALIRASGDKGMTGWEVCTFDHLMARRPESTVRTRVSELAAWGLIVPTDRVRPNRRGNDEIVWVAATTH